MRNADPRAVDVAAVLTSGRLVVATHEAAAILGYGSSEGFLRRQVRQRRALLPVFRSSPMKFRLAEVVACAS